MSSWSAEAQPDMSPRFRPPAREPKPCWSNAVLSWAGRRPLVACPFPGLFDAWGKQVIAGIGWELVKECVELDSGTLPNFAKVPQRHWQNQVLTNQFLYVLLAEEKCTDAGVEIAFHEFPHTVTKTENGWTVDCVGFGTNRRVNCKQIIDCTGGAEVVGMLGFSRLREEERQPGSYLFPTG